MIILYYTILHYVILKIICNMILYTYYSYSDWGMVRQQNDLGLSNSAGHSKICRSNATMLNEPWDFIEYTLFSDNLCRVMYPFPAGQ